MRTPSLLRGPGSANLPLYMTFADFITTTRRPSLGTEAVDNVLKAIREHLGMDVAFVSEFRETDRVFWHVSARDRTPIQPGDSAALQDGYCQRVVDGRLPELIPDTKLIPAAVALPETAATPIGAHLSVPVRLSDGRLFGTLCCFSFASNPSLGERDIGILRAFASLLGAQIERDFLESKSLVESRARITGALRAGQPAIVYQPIYHLKTGRLAGLEGLSRFNLEPARPPNEWFAEAAEVGMGADLELAAIRTAIESLPRIPADAYLSVNCSPQTILDARLQNFLQGVDLQRVVLEVTEHDYINDYPALLSVLTPLRALGLRVAIDDAGAGYASLRHVLNFQPEKIKLDISLTKNLDADPKRRALASALIAFGREIHSHIVAEGVETAAELATLMRIGVDSAQGYFLARPMPLEEALAQSFPKINSAAGRGATPETSPAKLRS
jgi:EAL domain-containing protein (putative c-di-GMP-specific phosphodiesterase class I)